MSHDHGDNGYCRSKILTFRCLSFVDLERPTVAFSAEGIGNATLLTNQTIVFTNLILNIGDAYNSSTGIFTAPVNGLYMFSVQMCAQHRSRSQFRVFAGPKVIQSILHDSYHSMVRVSSTAGTVAQSLTAGEEVWIQNADSPYYELSRYSNDCWNHFGGVLIH